ncbi:unnamed protein product [Aureobasidium pullulans]|nr:unnamed protein product [Aureobasidium pullulans]
MAVNMNTSQFLGLDVDRRATSPTPGTSLPEDDGMRSLRLKMHEIRNLAASTEEKARAMHLLMTKDYITMNHPDHDMPDLFAQGPLCHPVRSNDNPYNITPQDLEPSYYLMHVTYRCPVCNKSAVNMELQWRKLDDEIRLQPMPEDEFEDSAAAKVNPTHRRIPRKVFVGCNDCGGRGWSNFHWLGLKCPHCDGYNTSQTAPLGSETPGARPIVRRHEFAGVNALPAVRFSRSLSPMRYYLEGLDVSGSAAASGHTLDDTSSTPKDEQRRPQTAESRESSFWGEGNAGVFFGDVSESDEEEEEDEDAEDEDEEESEDDEDDEDSDDEDDDGVGSDFGGDRDAFHVEEDDLRLPGHM